MPSRLRSVTHTWCVAIFNPTHDVENRIGTIVTELRLLAFMDDPENLIKSHLSDM